MMEKRQVYQGIVRTGRGAGAGVMSAPGVLDGIQRFTGLPVIPGTLNVRLTQSLDMTLLNYVSFAELGWGDFSPAEYGIDYDGEVGMHYRRIIVADKYPAYLIIFTWSETPFGAELISPHHLRSALDVKDGDSIEFMLVGD